ncbi:putative cysteine-rich receptor-like protein kinase 35 [Morella rubra]|uniref:non-specific serine/threonine protein kinase n=1 Tax=Morella rubra TaxID=262757 RepID=A0A6A1UFF7_9ROSI|nr:putative cysteine-rich receptor-like protein kinase 35 [Morella rubra]
MPLYYSPTIELGSVYPVESIRRNVDWGLVWAFDYHTHMENITRASAALYDPASNVNTDYGLGCFDDVDAVRIKIAYAKEKKLRGYFVYAINDDENWVLSRAAASTTAQVQERGPEYRPQVEERALKHKPKLTWIFILPVALIIILLAITITYKHGRVLRLKCMILFRKRGLSGPVANASATENLGSNVPNLQVFSFSSIKAATNDFSSENELGKGGFGPVYKLIWNIEEDNLKLGGQLIAKVGAEKPRAQLMALHKGKLPTGQHIAVKRLSKTSTQGHEEFTNEVTLTARLQHRNLVRVLGYCIEREEKMLIYEYMRTEAWISTSLGSNPICSNLQFLSSVDPNKRNIIDWGKLVNIIEGVIQGLLYLQEYSNLTIIHRDLKASNILLDKDMNPKISDFGMAKLFGKDEHEANTDRIVGTYGYVPPEYVRRGIRVWKVGGGMQFIDPSLNDSSSPCKLLRCLQVALLCVQETPVDRPTMLGIYSMLRNDTEPIATPKRPAFSTRSDENVGSKQGSSSVSRTLITEILPR